MQAQNTKTFISEYIYYINQVTEDNQQPVDRVRRVRGNIKIRPWQSSPIFVLSLDIDTSLAPYLGLYIIKMRCCMLWRQKGRFINKSFYTMSKIRSSSSSSSRAQLCSGYESYDSQIPKLPPSNGYFQLEQSPVSPMPSTYTHHTHMYLENITNKFALLWGEAQLCLPIVTLR